MSNNDMIESTLRFFLMSYNFDNFERNRHCIFGRNTNWDNLSQGLSDINANILIIDSLVGNVSFEG